MGKLKEFAQDLAKIMGFENINNDVLEIGQMILDAHQDPICFMKIAKHIRKERFIRVCCVCKRYLSDGEWVEPKLTQINYKGKTDSGYKINGEITELIYPQSKQTHGFCPECYNEFYKDEIAQGILKAV